MRFVLGPKHASIQRQATQTGPPPPASGGTKADVMPLVKSVDPSFDPLPITLNVPAHDLAVHNKLVSITAIAIPMGSAEPTTPAEWMASAYPKITVDATTPAAPTTGADPTTGAQGQQIPTPAPLQAGTATSTTATMAVTGSALPTEAGGDVTLMIPGVPNGMTNIQTILGFET